MVIDYLRGLADQSLLALWFALVLILVVATETGFRLGRWVIRRKPVTETQRTGVGFVTAGMLGLLAFLLGIALSLGQGRYEVSRAAVQAEANAIGTAWLRAGLFAGEAGERLQGAIAAYAAMRLEAIETARSDADVERWAAETAAQQGRIWAQATGLARQRPDAISGALVASLNDMFDRASDQRRAFSARMPLHIARLLLWTFVATVAAVGYHFAITGSRQFTLSTILLLMWATALVLIVDINRPLQGGVRVDGEPLRWTLEGFGPSRP